MTRSVSSGIDMAFISQILNTSLEEDLKDYEYYIEEHVEETAKQPPVPSVWKELTALCLKIILISVVFALIFTFVYGVYQNIDIGATPMIKSGDLVMFYRLDKEYSVGDLVVLNFQGERQVRRVVAKGGDTVDITEDGLVINGSLQQEPNIFQSTWRYENGPSFPLTVGQNQVFVLGDARENATDSRVYGSVDKEETLGSVITIIRRRNL